LEFRYKGPGSLTKKALGQYWKEVREREPCSYLGDFFLGRSRRKPRGPSAAPSLPGCKGNL
jgi:hypothetical protein